MDISIVIPVYNEAENVEILHRKLVDVLSKSKKKWMEAKFEQENLDKTILDKIHCPMGLPIGNNSPAEIAVSISAQLLQERDKQAVL